MWTPKFVCGVVGRVFTFGITDGSLSFGDGDIALGVLKMNGEHIVALRRLRYAVWVMCIEEPSSGR
jgi:hypothetical protein